MNKEQTRKFMLEKRRAMSKEEVKAASDIICNKVSVLEEYKKAGTVLFYYPSKNEADLTEIINKALEEGKTVCLPLVENGDGMMSARRINSLSELEAGKYDILSPPKDSAVIKAKDIDLVFVPLVGFNDKLQRVGHGGGYYDRFLPRCDKAFKCGIAYSFQKCEFTGNESHDVALDEVITEK